MWDPLGSKLPNMKNTLIEWAHHTVNFWWGCVFARFADGTIRLECVNCYAVRPGTGARGHTIEINRTDAPAGRVE